MKIATYLLVYLTIFCGLLSAQVKTNAASTSQSKQVDNFVRDVMSQHHIPGLSVAVVRDGKVILAKGYGFANLENSIPANEKTAFALFSLTKTFTAAAAMLLVEEGKISLDDPISTYLTDMPAAWNRVTIRHLLSHTSGLPEWRDELSKLPDVRSDYAKTEVLKLIADRPLIYPSGERWEYTETNFTLLGLLIEKISGKPYEQFLRERIFSPLAMRDTRLDSYVDLIPHRANGYSWNEKNYVNAPRYSWTITFSTAGLVSTVLDLAKWDAALYTNKVLKDPTREQMWTRGKLNNGQLTDYGLGFGLTPFRGHRRAGHAGGAEGFGTAISRFIDDKITVIVLTNVDADGFLVTDIANQIAAFYFHKP